MLRLLLAATLTVSLASALHAQDVPRRVDPVADAARTAGADPGRAQALAAAVAGEVRLTSSMPTEGSGFGFTVSLSGDRALIGVTSYTADDAAYVFDYDGTTWALSARIVTTDGYRGDFGFSVSLDGDDAVIGSPRANIQTLPGIPQTGAAYVFHFDGTTWVQQAKLFPTDSQYGGDYFGLRVAISGDRIVAGAIQQGFTIPNDTGGEYVDDVGAAYVFVRTGATWAQEAKLTPAVRQDHRNFGQALAIDGDRAVVTARGRTADHRGEMFVYTRSGGTWTEQAHLQAADVVTNDQFGFSVAIAGGRIVAGALPFPSLQGAAYVFDYDTGTAAWTQTARLTASDGAADDRFGGGVDVLGDRLVVGAYGDDSAPGPCDEDGNCDPPRGRGAAYVFALDDGAWVETARIRASDGVAGDYFGYAVGLSDTHVLAGAFGVNNSTGAAYVFPLARAPITVTDAGDDSDVDLDDGICDVDLAQAGEQCSLRAALEVANHEGGVDRVVFDVQGDAFAAGQTTILLDGALPDVTEPVEIDAAVVLGGRQRAAGGPPLVVLDGGDTVENGIVLKAGGSTVRGMAIVGFTGAAVRIEGPGGNRVEGNYLGVDPDGTTLHGNLHGVFIDGSRENVIGGDTAAERNVIGVPPTPAGTVAGDAASGITVTGDAADGNRIAGNTIGITATGTAMLADATAPRTSFGILIVSADSTDIGGSAAAGTAPGNVISGLQFGILIGTEAGPASTAAAFDTQIRGNLIGTNAAGTDSLSNGAGIYLRGGALFTQIGGATLAEGNVISGNQGPGIALTDSETDVDPIGTRIVGNTVGLTANGLTPLGNLFGIIVTGEKTDGVLSAGVRGAIVGDPGYPRNLVAGNRIAQIVVYGAGYPTYAESDDPAQVALAYTFIRNTYVGLRADGQVAATDTERPFGILVAGGARAYIGAEDGRNVISGNSIGLLLDSEKNVVASNYIGTDPSGVQARPNTVGVLVAGAPNLIGVAPASVTTGGDALERGNLISGNDFAGVYLAPSVPSAADTTDAEHSARTSRSALGDLVAAYGGGARQTLVRAGGAGARRSPLARRGAAGGGTNYDDAAFLIGNRVGVSATGAALPNGAAFVPDPDFPEAEVGGGILAFYGQSVLLLNNVAGNVGDGIAAYDTRDGGTELTLAGNQVGLSVLAPVGQEAVPNTRDGVFNLGATVVIGGVDAGGSLPDGSAVLTDRFWYNGRNGVSTAAFGQMSLGNASFLSNAGLGLDAGIAAPDGAGVPPGFLLAPGLFNPTLVVAGADSTLHVPLHTPPATVTGGAVEHRVQLYLSGSCDASGYGEGAAAILGTTAAPATDTAVDIPITGASADFRHLADVAVYLTATVTQRLDPNGGFSSDVRTSEFTECRRLVLPEDAAQADVTDGQSGPLLDGPGIGVTGDGGGDARARGATRAGAGTLYAARHTVAPEQNTFAGTATAPDGTPVVADTTAARYWTVSASDGLTGLAYTACLDAAGLALPPSAFVVLQRPRLGAPWTAHDATLDPATDRVCAAGLAGTGDLALGFHAEAVYATAVESGNPGWRMLSAPVDGLTVTGLAARNLVQGVPGFYPDAGTNLFAGFDGTAFTRPTAADAPLAPGRGFLWYLYGTDIVPGGPSRSRALPMTLTLGGDLPPAEVTLPLIATGDGWNLVGNPFPTTLDVSAMGTWATGGALASNVGQVWDPNVGSTGSYVPTTLLGDAVPAWTGLFVENDDATALVVPSAASAPRGAAPRLVALELSGATTAGDTLRDRAAVAVFRDGATVGWDAWDALKLAPLGGPSVTAAFVGERAGETVAMAQASAPAEPAEAVALPLSVASDGAGARLVLSWPRLDVPAAWQLTLLDAETGTVVYLREASSYAFDVAAAGARATDASAETAGRGVLARPVVHALVAGAARFTLLVQPRGATATEADAPRVLALRAPTPNPARETARVEVDVPTAAHVRVAVYDALGREVARLADGDMPAGRHALSLDASRLASGVYVVRMTSGDFAATRRLTVVR